MTDFFISYTRTDLAWAEWIGYVLEEEGFNVIIQAWDFRPGKNFALEMQEAATRGDRTLMVLSPDYLRSQFASPEWAAAFGQDPQGREMKLVPVMVRACEPEGLLGSIVQIRIVGLNEKAARKELVAGISQKRAKPSSRPAFPGTAARVEHKAFPGGATPPPKTGRSSSAGLIPSLKRPPSDLDKRRFAREGFDTIKTLFEANLRTVSQDEVRIETDFQATTATDFRAELFLDGSRNCVCRVWMGGAYLENNICYSESRHSDNSCNEILALSNSDELRFYALMAMGVFKPEKAFDMKRLSAQQAAEYLWQRFVSPLDHR